MSEKGLNEKLLNEINKTGFPFELRISKFLQDNGYYVANNLYYIDRDEDKGRELDLRALKNFEFDKFQKHYYVRHCLLIECKRSLDKPWVIFTSPVTAYDKAFFDIDNCGFNDQGNKEKWGLYKNLEEIHPFTSYPRRGRSYFEAFKKSGEPGDLIFKALTTSVKATIATRDSKFASGALNICFYYPLILFEGKLFEAHYEHDNICVAEAESAIVSFFYESARYKNESFAVSVVTESSLPKFVFKLDSVLNFWGEILKKNFIWFSTN
jgi:hypothetical protein